MTDTFYRRPLPAPAIALSVPEGRRLFGESLGAGTMEGYFALAEQFHTQAEPAYCGLATLVVVLNALAIDPGRVWKGPWRWYSEELLDCCKPLEQVKAEGIAFDELACVARCNGARAEALRGDTLALSAFRTRLVDAARTPGEPHAVVAYSRAALDQTGDGHYSPIGGVNQAADLALVLDTARFKYPPHWVPIPTLWEATRRVDSATGQARGLLLFTRAEHSGTLCAVTCHVQSWGPVAQWLRTEAIERLTVELHGQNGPRGAIAALLRVLDGAPQPLARGYQLPATLPTQLGRLLEEVRSLPIYAVVDEISCGGDAGLDTSTTASLGGGQLRPEVTTLLLLALPQPLLSRLGPNHGVTLESPSAALEREVGNLRAQIQALTDGCCR